MAESVRDYFLPEYIESALRHVGRFHTSEAEFDDSSVRVEHLIVDPEIVRIIARELRQRQAEINADRDGLRNRSNLAKRLVGLQRLSEEITRSDSPLRCEALSKLPAMIGFSPEMVGILLHSLSELMSGAVLEKLDPALPPNAASIRFVETSYGYARFYSGSLGLSAPRLLTAIGYGQKPCPVMPVTGVPRVVSNIAAGNVPGISILEAFFPALIGAASLGKNSSEEPYFAPRFFAELATIERREQLFPLSDLVALVTFPGSARRLLAEIIHQGDHLRVTGGLESKRDIAHTVRRLRPRSPRDFKRRVSGHWHKVSIDIVAREYLDPDWIDTVAFNVAFDNSMFNTQGCLSCQQVLVEGDDAEVERFAHRFVEHMHELLTRLPKGFNDEAALRSMYHHFENRADTTILTKLSDMKDSPFFVAIDRAASGFHAYNALNRSILIRKVVRLEQDLARLLGHGRDAQRRDLLQSCGAAIPRDRLIGIGEVLGRAGVNRIVAAGDIWNMIPGLDSWDGYLPPYDLLAPQNGYWTTIGFHDPDECLLAVYARNRALLESARTQAQIETAHLQPTAA